MSSKKLTIAALALFAVAIVTAIALAESSSHKRELMERLESEQRGLAAHLASDLDKGMLERLREVESLSLKDAIYNYRAKPEKARELIEKFAGLDEFYTWVAITDTEGNVVMANKGLLEGKNVSARDWFKPCLKGPYTGDIHPAVLLAKLVPNPDGTAPYFVDIGFPLYDDKERLTGVLIAHVNWRMADLYTRAAQQEKYRDTQVLVTGANGMVSYGPPALKGKIINIRDIAGMETRRWEGDQQDYLVTVAATRGLKEYTGLGWKVVVRTPAGQIQQAVETWRLQTAAKITGLAALFILIGFTLAISRSKSA